MLDYILPETIDVHHVAAFYEDVLRSARVPSPYGFQVVCLLLTGTPAAMGYCTQGVRVPRPRSCPGCTTRPS